VYLSGETFILRTMLDPDGVEVNILGEGSEERKDVDYLCGVRREFGLVDGGGEFGRLREVEGQRNVLGEVQAAVGEGVVADIRAEGVATGASRGGGCNLSIDLFANFRAHGTGVGEICVIAADIEGYGDVEERFAGFKGNRGAARLRLRDTGSRFRRYII
jgi:hypothetical protein